MQRRIGITMTFAERVTRQEVLDVARRAEELGYDTLWMSESWGRDAFTALTHIACHTSRIRLAPGIVSIYARSPAMTAQSMAALDEIADGRTALGLGVGSQKLTEEWHGVPFDHPMGRIREYTEVVRRILSGERVDYEGKFYRVRDMKPLFRPVQQRLPIYLAGLGPRMVELAGEVADGWFPNFMSIDGLRQSRECLSAGARKSGRDPAATDIYTQRYTVASADGKRARDLTRTALAFIVGGYGGFYQQTAVRLGFAEEVEAIKKLWAADRRNIGAGVSDAFLDALTTCGTPQQCRDRHLELEEQGMTPISLGIPQSIPMDVIHETIEAMAPARF